MKKILISRDLLCGRNALDLRPFLFFAPISILVIPLQESNISEERNFILWSIVSVLSFLAQLLFIKLLQIILIKKRNYQPFAVWVIFAIGGASGAVKAFVVYISPQFLEMQVATFSLANRILAGTFVGICVVPIFAVISNQFTLVTQRRKILMEALIVEESLKYSNQEALQRVREATQIAIESEFSSLISETRKQIKNTEGKSLEQQYELIANALTLSAQNLIRPLSHRLMQELSQDFPSPSLRSIFFIAIKKPILPILPILCLANIASAIVVIRDVISIPIIFLILFIQTLFIFIQIISIIAFAKSRMSMKSSVNTPIFIGFSTFCSVFADFVMLHSILHLDYQFLSAELLVLNFIWRLAFICVVSFVINLIENEAAVEQFISELISTHKIDKMLADQEILRVKQDIARYLHGNLQSRVMALGLSLKVREIKDQVSMDSALSLSQSLLDSPFSEYLAAEDRSLFDEVSFNATKWDGLLNIHINIEIDDLQLSQIQKRAVGTALEEAFANALRHGLAKEVEIKIYQDGLGITVAVLDDGVGPRNTPLGLGSRLYDSVATRGWSLQHRLDDEGAILELRI
jgi:signal transduction histidine kinase